METTLDDTNLSFTVKYTRLKDFNLDDSTYFKSFNL